MLNQYAPRIRRLALEGGWIVAGQAASVVGSLMLIRVLTAHLNPTQYGQLALGLTVATLVSQLVMGGVINAIGRFFAVAAAQQTLSVYLRASRQLMLQGTLAVLVIVVGVVVGLIGWNANQWIPISLAALFFSVLSSYNAALSGIQNAARQRAIVALHSGLDAWLKILLSWIVLHYWGASGTAVVLAYGFSALLVTGSQLRMLRRVMPADQQVFNPVDLAAWRSRMWRYSWPFASWGIFTWLQLVSDRWALEVFASTEDVGFYTVLFQIGMTPITIAATATMSFLGPILYGRSGDAQDAARNTNVRQITLKVTWVTLSLTLLGFLIAFWLHSWVFRCIVDAKYGSASYLLPWMVLAGGVVATGQILALKLMSDMKPGAMAQAKIVTALVGVGLNALGAAYAGLVGVVAAQLVFSFVYLAWMVRLAFHAKSTIKP